MQTCPPGPPAPYCTYPTPNERITNPFWDATNETKASLSPRGWSRGVVLGKERGCGSKTTAKGMKKENRRMKSNRDKRRKLTWRLGEQLQGQKQTNKQRKQRVGSTYFFKASEK